MSVEKALLDRRSARTFSANPLALADLGQLLWAGQGITDRRRGYRTAPSAGALYPLLLYVVAGNVTGLDPGVYRYDPDRHALTLVQKGDRRAAVAAAASGGQNWIGRAPVILVLAADYGRTSRKYGSRAERYVHIESGNASENIYLQATSLGISTALVGAIDDRKAGKALALPAKESPVLFMPVGHLE